MNLNLYHTQNDVTALGAGKRFGIWVQGCTFACSGCLVPDSWSPRKGKLRSVDSIVQEIISIRGLDGITISGGEPLLQVEGLIYLLSSLYEHAPELTSVLYTGFELNEAVDHLGIRASQLFGYLDILIDGRFDSDLLADDWTRGSTNQKIYFLTERVSMQELINSNSHLDVYINEDDIFYSGIPSAYIK